MYINQDWPLTYQQIDQSRVSIYYHDGNDLIANVAINGVKFDASNMNLEEGRHRIRIYKLVQNRYTNSIRRMAYIGYIDVQS